VPLNPGVTSITFNPPGRFVVDQYHTQPASSGLTQFVQTGCNVQTTTLKDKIDNTAYAEATHKAFTPYNTSTADVEPEWTITYTSGGESKTLRVIGAHRTQDSWGRVYQCMFICKEEQG
jgi:hypothetical protein